MTDQEKIEKFNKETVEFLVQYGTLRLSTEKGTLIMEIDSWNIDNSPAGFTAWFEGHDGVETLGNTPYEAYNDALAY